MECFFICIGTAKIYCCVVAYVNFYISFDSIKTVHKVKVTDSNVVFLKKKTGETFYVAVCMFSICLLASPLVLQLSTTLQKHACEIHVALINHWSRISEDINQRFDQLITVSSSRWMESFDGPHHGRN